MREALDRNAIEIYFPKNIVVVRALYICMYMYLLCSISLPTLTWNSSKKILVCSRISSPSKQKVVFDEQGRKVRISEKCRLNILVLPLPEGPYINTRCPCSAASLSFLQAWLRRAQGESMPRGRQASQPFFSRISSAWISRWIWVS